MDTPEQRRAEELAQAFNEASDVLKANDAEWALESEAWKNLADRIDKLKRLAETQPEKPDDA